MHLLAAIFVLVLPGSWSQEVVINSVDKVDKLEEIRESIDSVETSASILSSQTQVVKIKARAANLIWRIDRENGRLRFKRLWEWINNNMALSKDLERARAELLTQIYLLDRELANSLIDTVERDIERVETASLMETLRGNVGSARLRSEIAIRAVDENPEVAAWLISDEMKQGYNYPLHSAIVRLGAKDQQIGERLVSQLINTLDVTTSDSSIVGAQQLFNYFFPSKYGATTAESARPLTDLYVRSSIKILERSLGSNRVKRAPEELRVIEMSQALLATQLNSVTGKLANLEPEIVEKVSSLSKKLRHLVPAELAGIVDSSLMDDTKQTSTVTSSNNVHDKTGRELFEAIVKRGRDLTNFRLLLGQGELVEALLMALSVEDRQLQLQLLEDQRRVVIEAKEPYFADYITTLMLRSLADISPSERKTELILSLIASGNAGKKGQPVKQFWKLLKEAVDGINTMPVNTDRLAAGSTFRNTFIIAAQIDKREALNTINDLKPGIFELMARLAISESLLKQEQVGASQQ
jgi:hypothetical protein